MPSSTSLPKIPLVVHVPHSSTRIPADELGDYCVDETVLRRHVAQVTDHFTDQLFNFDDDDVTVVTFPVSRLVVDPERFEDDSKECMAKRGYGVLYQNGPDGTEIRPPVSAARREILLDRWYRPHHLRLELAVDEALVRYGRVLIIDAHSYPHEPMEMDKDKDRGRPAGCIGTDKYHTPELLATAALDWCKSHGRDFWLNKPYSGSLAPKKHYLCDPRVWSIMIEVNRSTYMTVTDGEAVPTGGFGETHGFVKGLVEHLRGCATAGFEA